MNATLDVVVDHATRGLPGACSASRSFASISGRTSSSHLHSRSSLSFQARFYTHARGSAMEAAAALDTMRVMKLVGQSTYDRGNDLLEGIVAMLTKMT